MGVGLQPWSLEGPDFFASPSEKETRSTQRSRLPACPQGRSHVHSAQGPASVAQTSIDVGSGLCVDRFNTYILAFLSTPCLQGGAAAGLRDRHLRRSSLSTPQIVGVARGHVSGYVVCSGQLPLIVTSHCWGEAPGTRVPSPMFSPSTPGDALLTGEGSPWPQTRQLLPPQH